MRCLRRDDGQDPTAPYGGDFAELRCEFDHNPPGFKHISTLSFQEDGMAHWHPTALAEWPPGHCYCVSVVLTDGAPLRLASEVIPVTELGGLGVLFGLLFLLGLKRLDSFFGFR